MNILITLLIALKMQSLAGLNILKVTLHLTVHSVVRVIVCYFLQNYVMPNSEMFSTSLKELHQILSGSAPERLPQSFAEPVWQN